MFLTIESARLPCCTTFSRLPFSIAVSSAISARSFSSSGAASSSSPQLVDQFARQRGEVVDEVERVLDLVRDAGGELAERGELLRLHEAVLRGPQILERARQLLGPCLHLLEQPHVLDRDHRLVGEGL